MKEGSEQLNDSGLLGKLKSKLKKLLFKEVYYELSYSQEGEDMVLNRIFNPHVNTEGFYIDVGAHHPQRFSNTYYFYNLGWRGINIDAMPDSMGKFNKIRSRDINLEIPINDSEKELVYYSFNEPALNGFSKELTESRNEASNSYYVKEEIILKTQKLSKVLDAYMPEGVEIDFMSIDVEGLDFSVLQSNDWNKYKPKVILVEVLGDSIEDFYSNDVYQYLKKLGYMFYAKTVNTVFFKRNDVDI
jgi:FkbM family methyltransferase